jgi:lipoprotein-releasing system permease protein
VFYFKFALRYLRGRKKLFFNFSNTLSLFGIIIGVFSLLIVSSVMSGFSVDMQKRIVGLKSEIKVHNVDYSAMQNYDELLEIITKNDGVKASSPVCETELMIQKKKNIAFTICRGINFEKHSKITNIFEKNIFGKPSFTNLQNDGIIIGVELAQTLLATIGEEVQISSPIGTEPTPFGLLPKSKKLKVVGIFASGMPEYDRVFSFISLPNAQYLMGYGNEIGQIEIKTTDKKKSQKIAIELQKILGKSKLVEDWSEFDANLFGAIKMEKIVMFFVLALMIVIASFNMTGNFIKLITERKTEIGILKTMGASDKDIVKIFVLAGSIVGVVGTLIATVLALIMILLQREFHFIQIPVAGLPLQWLPMDLNKLDFVLVPLTAILISVLTTLYPSRKTVSIDPIKIIRKQK